MIQDSIRSTRASAHRASFALLAVLALAGAAGAQKPPAPAPATAPAPADDAAAKAAAAKAAEAARLKAEFDRTSSDLRTAIAGFQSQAVGLQQGNVPREQWPPHPNTVFYPRFEALAVQDQPDALRWCLSAVAQIGLTSPEVAERKHDIYARLVVMHPDQPWMPDVARWLQSDARADMLGFERGEQLLRALLEGTTVPATRAAAIAGLAAILAPRTDPASQAEAARLNRELAEKHADTPAGAAAKGQLFKTEYLAPGRTPPDIAAVDTDGKPFRLSEFRGKVVVLDFFGFWCGPCVRELPHVKQIAEKHAQDPLVVIGIATDADLAEFQRKARDAGVTWRNAWAGGTSGTWPTTWGVQRYPSTYVLDAQGVVRHVDLRGDALAKAVEALLAEMRAKDPPAPR